MSRCSAGSIVSCNCPVNPGADGIKCAVCEVVLCKKHAGPAGMDLGACENCLRDCESCGQTFPANVGEEIGNTFLCRTCLRGEAVIRVELSPRDVLSLPRFPNELHLPTIPVYEERLETIA